MSTCIKTGGLIELLDYGYAFNCDLHLVRAPGRRSVAVIAYLACKPIHEFSPEHVWLRIPAGADYFYRAGEPYGVLVVPTAWAIPDKKLLEYIYCDPTVGEVTWAANKP